MAYIPDDEIPQPTRATRVREAVVAPVVAHRTPALLAAAAAAATAAPVPFGGIAAACLVLVASELARKR